MNYNYCSICLEYKNNTVRFGDLDDNNVNWLTKLKSIVPNLQEQTVENLICSICSKQLNEFLTFKEKVENLVERLKHVENSKKELPDNAYFEENNPSKSPISEGSNHANDYIDDLLPFDDPEAKQESENENIPIRKALNCSNCDQGFDNKKFLRLHKKLCKKQTYTCYTCNKIYNTKTALKLHQKKCELKSDIKQEKIEKTVKKAGRKSSRSYTCETCDGIFNLVKDLMAHCKNVHGIEERLVKPYSCNQCTQRFRTYAGFDQHLKYHSRSRDNVCSLCGKRFITKSELIVHEYTHFNRRNYKCTICGKAFNTNKNLKTHILVVHTERSAWKFACTICEKRFPQKGNFDQHMKRHAGDKQHICHICQKPFITSSELKRHVSLHSNVKAFTCEYCQREYKTMRTLKTHLRRSHSIGDKLPEKEKKFVCHICPSQFYDKQKLSRHLYCHSGIKPFQCTACEKRFADKSYLKYHMKVSHNLLGVNDDDVKYDEASDLKYELPEQLKFDI